MEVLPSVSRQKSTCSDVLGQKMSLMFNLSLEAENYSSSRNYQQVDQSTFYNHIRMLWLKASCKHIIMAEQLCSRLNRPLRLYWWLNGLNFGYIFVRCPLCFNLGFIVMVFIPANFSHEKNLTYSSTLIATVFKGWPWSNNKHGGRPVL